MSPEYDRHKKFKRTCLMIDRSFGAGGNTCIDQDNPSPIGICSHDCCPLKPDFFSFRQNERLKNLYNQLNYLRGEPTCCI
jgi:hypothetical protein